MPTERNAHLATGSTFAEKYFKRRSWQATVVRPEEGRVVPIAEGGLFGCGDGRKRVIGGSIIPYLGPVGPSVFGGWEGYMLLAVGSGRKSAAQAIRGILEQGFIPGEHDHCGAKSLARVGELPSTYPLRFELECDPTLMRKVCRYGVLGSHIETYLAVSLLPCHTPELDQDGDRFIFDAGYLRQQGVSLARSLDFAAGTVERLSDCRQVMIIAD